MGKKNPKKVFCSSPSDQLAEFYLIRFSPTILQDILLNITDFVLTPSRKIKVIVKSRLFCSGQNVIFDILEPKDIAYVDSCRHSFFVFAFNWTVGVVSQRIFQIYDLISGKNGNKKFGKSQNVPGSERAKDARIAKLYL